MGYATRGRAEELEGLIAELDRRLSARLDDVEAEMREQRRDVRKMFGLVVDVARRGVNAQLEAIRDVLESQRQGGGG